MEKIMQVSLDVIESRAKDTAYKSSSVLIFQEDAFASMEDKGNILSAK